MMSIAESAEQQPEVTEAVGRPAMETASVRRARDVLAALRASTKPMSAYDLMDRLSEAGERIAPTQMYRVIGQLKEAGFVVRVESRNAYIAAARVHAPDETVALLVCECCGRVEEADAAFIAPALTPAATARGFTPHRASLEVLGECGQCRDEPARLRPPCDARAVNSDCSSAEGR